ncbi:MAG: SIS domain-containing protein [Clostridia bacterium]|nr:SIS domain-containing protein [Clostridia bacterium]
MIKCIIFDIDGVITDGTISVDIEGVERKSINLKDVDSIYELKNMGYPIIAITGESEEKSKYFRERFPWYKFYFDKKEKLVVVKEIERNLSISADEICYIGDGKYDIEVLKHVGLSIAPQDAIEEAKLVANFILSKNSGRGGLAEIKKIIEIYNNQDEFNQLFYDGLIEHINTFRNILNNSNLTDKIKNVSDIIAKGILKNKKVYIFGNGGSAADAQHIAAEFVGRFKLERKAMNMEALTTNTSILTSIGNDYSYEKIFTRQLEAKINEGDIVIGISTSGNSKNVVDALKFSKENNAITVMMCGNKNDNTNPNNYCDYIIDIPNNDTPRIQEAHIFIGHMISEYVEKQITNIIGEK